MSNLLGVEPQVGLQLIHVVAGILGTASILLYVSMAFNLMNPKYALFGWFACLMLAGLVESLAKNLLFRDPQAGSAGNTKLQTALAMSVGPQRDQVLLKVAREAVEEGESAVAHMALQAIQDAKVRDEAAAMKPPRYVPWKSPRTKEPMRRYPWHKLSRRTSVAMTCFRR
jgi:hypothetical protein